MPDAGEVLCVVVVAWDCNRLNPNRVSRMHWGALTTRKNGAKVRAQRAWEDAGSPQFRVPVDVRVTVYRSRKLDDDNAWAALKWVRDVLFKSRITPDDSPDWLRYLPLEQQAHKSYKGREMVRFEVRRRV